VAGKVEEIIEKLNVLEMALLKKQSELDKYLEEYQLKVAPLVKEVKDLEAGIEEYRRLNIPNYTIAEAFDKTAGKKYVRASIRYYVEGSNRQKTTSIHLGKLSDFPFGLSDDNLLALAQKKAIELLIRKKDAKNAELGE
jgi:hypothetical protein